MNIHFNNTRNTRQKQAIFAVLDRSNHPLSPAEILARARDDVPTIGHATVYRTIRELVKEGRIAAVTIAGDAARYAKVCEGGHEQNQHFKCDDCGHVYRVSLPITLRDTSLPAGFRPTEINITCHGTCADCNDEP